METPQTQTEPKPREHMGMNKQTFTQYSPVFLHAFKTVLFRQILIIYQRQMNQNPTSPLVLCSVLYDSMVSGNNRLMLASQHSILHLLVQTCPLQSPAIIVWQDLENHRGREATCPLSFSLFLLNGNNRFLEPQQEVDHQANQYTFKV